MTTISVPLTDEMLKAIEDLIRDGIASNKADAMRKAMKKYLEDQAVEAVLQAQREPTLHGNFDDLLKKF
ncbi:ribbon-helix-helix protein, CopG family [Candidatus Peregrinibacteria bacterium]|nr:ribbon-helix-helix protein, CopG family [Candidatus Peregrinibacteria bacterium]